MSDSPPAEPRTEAGRALLALMLYAEDQDKVNRLILAIEAEASRPLAAPPQNNANLWGDRNFAGVNNAAAEAGAVEALRAALEGLVLAVDGHADVEPTETDGVPMERARAILNESAGAVEALDVERLRNAIHWAGMVLVDQVSGRPVDDGEKVLLRYLIESRSDSTPEPDDG